MPSAEQFKTYTVERRAAPRHRVLRAGAILIGDGSINCMARDMSIAGAMLGVTSSDGIPEYFTLILSPNGLYMPCRVIWRQPMRIGVMFV
jgi:PilZ domain